MQQQPEATWVHGRRTESALGHAMKSDYPHYWENGTDHARWLDEHRAGDAGLFGRLFVFDMDRSHPPQWRYVNRPTGGMQISGYAFVPFAAIHDLSTCKSSIHLHAVIRESTGNAPGQARNTASESIPVSAVLLE